jgi:GlpG protein
MRAIGQLPDQAAAAVFNDYLIVEGIQNEVEADEHGRWTVWVHEDDQLARGQTLLTEFLQNPGDPKYRKVAPTARELRDKEQAEEKNWRKRFYDRGSIWRGASWRVGGLTAALVSISVTVALANMMLGPEHPLIRALSITDYSFGDMGIEFVRGLPEIRSGQLWRVVTPIFVHFGVLHVFFNMMWLLDLGSQIEARLGTGRLAKLVLVIAVVSNLSQYWVTHYPAFGGMSGVVFGLFGYVWLRGKLDPRSGLYISLTNVILMLVWFVVCLTGGVGPIANMAHASGLVLGLTWGFLAAKLNPGE